MGFYGLDFTWKGVPSETYNLYISEPGGSGEASSSGGSGIELITQQIFKKSKPYFFGVTQSPVLTFDLSISSPDEISSISSQLIERWLFGNLKYEKLEIIQPDMTTVYFNCLLTDPQKIMSGNIIKGYSFTVICDSPFGWEFEKTKTINYATNPNILPLIFDNLSDDNYYLFPTLIITFDSFGGNLSIVNSSDNNRTFTLTGLLAGEVITINNYLQTIESSTGNRKLSNFNKKWMRFLPGRNNLLVTGDIAQIQIKYQFAKKLGG